MSAVTGKILDNEVSVIIGDVTRTGADAIVVPEFQSCASYGGVGGAVARNGAEKGMQNFDAYVSQNGEQKFGTVVLTASGGGSSRALLHVVSVGSGENYEFDTVKSCMFNSLKVAEQNGITSIAAPALGTGIIGSLTAKQSAEAMMAAIAEYKKQGGKSIPVSFVIYDDESACRDFAEVLRSGSYASANDAQVGRREFDRGRWVVGMSRDAAANRAKFGKKDPA